MRLGSTEPTHQKIKFIFAKQRYDSLSMIFRDKKKTVGSNIDSYHFFCEFFSMSPLFNVSICCLITFRLQTNPNRVYRSLCVFFKRYTNWTRWTNKNCLISEWFEVTPFIYHHLLKISFWKLCVNVNTIRCRLFYWKSAIRLLVLIIWIIICRIVFLSFCFCFVYSFRMLQITGKWQSQSWSLWYCRSLINHNKAHTDQLDCVKQIICFYDYGNGDNGDAD